ncbi:heparin lyase I family protein [Paraburkholderia sp. J10-1]|uniref:heparin lyase I family protein n=1 Tax=Paraburkholderia sp. J10-1 TaxID=2805430 RepID=UPI002AB79385|nr:heparin lyase I family protein [Paraburkholderia sp. J10-1]
MRKILTRVGMFVAVCMSTACSSQITGADGYESLYGSTWAQGIDPRLVIQAPRDAISTVESPVFHERVMRVTIHRSDDFHSVANGTPRGELAFNRIFHFEPDQLYQITWSTALPQNYQFDSQQPELFTQILQGPEGGIGPPPFSIRFVNGRYQVEIRNAAKAAPRIFVFGNPSTDRGKAIHWVLNYRPDHAGKNALTDLSMNGVSVVHCEGCGNAYANDQAAYLKMGVYKWWWQSRPSDVSERTIFFGNVEVKRFLAR